MSNPAIHDFFRKIKLISPDGSTVQSTLEADSVTDELTISGSEGLAFVPDDTTDSVKLDVDYAFFVPVGTTTLRLEDVNNNTREIALRGGLGVTVSRGGSDDIVFSSFSVAETDSLQSVTARGSISADDLIINNLTIGQVNSQAGIDGMSSIDAKFTGQGTLYFPLDIDPAYATSTASTYNQTFTFSTQTADGILQYAIAYELDSTVSSASMVFEREDPNNPGTWITLESVTNPAAGAYVAANTYSQTYDGAVNYRLVFAFTGNTGEITLQGTFRYEVLDVAENPVLQTDTANETITVSNLIIGESIESTNSGGNTVTANFATIQGKNLTSGRVAIVGTDGLIEDDAGLTYNKTTDTLSVSGGLDVSGDLTIGGTITIGDGEGDTIEFTAGTSSNFLPAEDLTYNIGSNALRWQSMFTGQMNVSDNLYVTGEIFGGPLNTDDIRIAGNRLETTSSNADLEIEVAGTGNVEILAPTNITGATGITGDLDVTGQILVNSNVLVKTVNGTSIGIGIDSLKDVSTGISNTSLGNESMATATIGSNNTALGYRALKMNLSGLSNTGIGSLALNAVTGSNNTALGYNAGSNITTGENNLVLGNSAAASSLSATNEITLGNGNISRFRIPGLNIDYQATTAFKLPVGDTSQRPTALTGHIRYNSERATFEGYNGSVWQILPGLIDADKDTYILPEDTIGGDEDQLKFYTGGQLSGTLSSNSLVMNSAVSVSIPSTTTTLAVGQGALVVGGGVSIAGNLIVGGEIINANIQTENSIGTQGTPVAGAGNQGNQITVDSSVIAAFEEGGNIKLYGASLTNTAQTNTGLNLALARVGFNSPGVDPATTFSYKIAQFDFTTGKFCATDPAVNIDILTSDLNNFNNVNNIQLTLARENSSKGLLIYRQVGTEIDYKLITVLGTKELGTNSQNIQWTDYYTYDQTPWNHKDAANAFDSTSGVIHFPVTAPSSASLGWFDATIDSVDTNTNVITTVEDFYPEATMLVYNDDTETLQEKIDLAVSTNLNVLELDARIYYVSQLDMPKNFTLYGAGEQTRLNKLPWSTNVTSGSNEIITIDTYAADAEKMTVRQMQINGNAQNQYLVDDDTFAYKNYAIRLFGEDIIIENIELTNVIAGGIYSYDETLNTSDVAIYQCQINSGGLTYRYEHGPIVVTEAQSVRITQNSIKDFTSYIDFSAVQKGVIANNIVENCGSGIFGFGIINSIINPNVLIGPAGEFIPNPDILNSEYDSVNIRLETGVDYNSPSIVYQENGVNFDLAANQGFLSSAINELKKINGVETISTDYTQTAGGTDYISFLSSPTVDPTEGELRFRITQTLVDDLLSRANFETLYAADTNSVGLVYRIFTTEYVPLTNLVTQSPVTNSDQGGGVYRVEVEDVSGFSENDVVRLVNHSSTPSLATTDGTITAINNVAGTIDIDFGTTITGVASNGSLALKNTFVVVKGKIN